MMDYKDNIQARAEEIAWNDYDCDFYDLSDELQDKVYALATDGYVDSMAARADYLNDIAKEN